MLAEWGHLPPLAYCDPAWDERERAAVFQRNWICVGMTDDYARPGDYATFSFGGVDLVVRRGASGISAFRNVCSHRHSRILPCGHGRAEFRCGYHGWTYGDDGVPVGLPGNRTNFGLSEEEKRTLRLEEFRLDTVGRFLFARLAAGGESLVDSIEPPIHDLLCRISEHSAAAFSRDTEHWEANWKLAVENTLEPYHAPFVHAESLGGKIDVSRHEADISTKHSTSVHPLTSEDARWWSKACRLGGWEASLADERYRHLLIFPNLLVAMHRGILVSVQVFYPETPRTCVLEYRQLLPKVADDVGKPHWRQLFQREMAAFNKRVLDEDRAVVEACQAGISQASRVAILANDECRVRAFQAVVRSAVDTASSQRLSSGGTT